MFTNIRWIREQSTPHPHPPTTLQWGRSQSESFKLELSAEYLTPLAVYSSGAPTKDQNDFFFGGRCSLNIAFVSWVRGEVGGEGGRSK